jgi:retron-type reverse transcriptase
MQHKLATWAESDPNRRYDRLLRLIATREWLAEAARIVLASSGARTPGIDGIDKQRLQVRLDQHLEDLRKSLEAYDLPRLLNDRARTIGGYKVASRIAAVTFPAIFEIDR